MVEHRVNVRHDPVLLRRVYRVKQLRLRPVLGRDTTLLVELSEIVDIIDVVPDAVLSNWSITLPRQAMWWLTCPAALVGADYVAAVQGSCELGRGDCSLTRYPHRRDAYVAQRRRQLLLRMSAGRYVCKKLSGAPLTYPNARLLRPRTTRMPESERDNEIVEFKLYGSIPRRNYRRTMV